MYCYASLQIENYRMHSLTTGQLALFFYERMVNEAQPSLIANEGE